MITLTRLSGSQFALNSDLIERIDSTPDTVITLVDGTKYVVAETLADVIAIVRAHRAEVLVLSGYINVGQTQDLPESAVQGLAKIARYVARPNLSVVESPDAPRDQES